MLYEIYISIKENILNIYEYLFKPIRYFNSEEY